MNLREKSCEIWFRACTRFGSTAGGRGRVGLVGDDAVAAGLLGQVLLGIDRVSGPEGLRRCRQ